MNYRLVVLTSPPGHTLARSVASFAEHVTPAPIDVAVVSDGYGPDIAAVAPALPEGGAALNVRFVPPRGFCAATKAAWEIGVSNPILLPGMAEPAWDYVFHLEHDFVFTRPVDLRELALVLDANRDLAQMALMRDAASGAERAAGGLYESRPGEYAPRFGWPCVPGRAKGLPWLEHSSYFTTNPSLMRRAFMAENPWPDYPERCEGRFGIDLSSAGYSFGVWGSGEPWVHHIGRRDGFGY